MSSGIRTFRLGVLGWLGMSVDDDRTGTDELLSFQRVAAGVASGACLADDTGADGLDAVVVAGQKRGQAGNAVTPPAARDLVAAVVESLGGAA